MERIGGDKRHTITDTKHANSLPTHLFYMFPLNSWRCININAWREPGWHLGPSRRICVVVALSFLLFASHHSFVGPTFNSTPSASRRSFISAGPCINRFIPRGRLRTDAKLIEVKYGQFAKTSCTASSDTDVPHKSKWLWRTEMLVQWFYSDKKKNALTLFATRHASLPVPVAHCPAAFGHFPRTDPVPQDCGPTLLRSNLDPICKYGNTG